MAYAIRKEGLTIRKVWLVAEKGILGPVDGRPGLKRVVKKCSCGWNSKRPGARCPFLRYRSFVGLEPHANPKNQGIDFFSNL
jgi:hypothetical protein